MADEPIRLDHLIARRLGVSAAAARRLIADGRARVSGGRPRKGTLLQPGERVEIVADAAAESVAPDPTAPLEILYEDDVLVAIAKPAGLPSHPLRAGELGTAVNALVARFPSCASASPDLREGGLVHRLDNDTSGVLLAARDRATWSAMRAELASNTCEKIYLAEVEGAPPPTGTMTAPIGRHGRRGASVRVGGGRRPQDAVTVWKVLAQGGQTSLLEARLHVGRPHQVRAHLAAAGHPIVGDPIYGEPRAGVTLRLHAAAIRFRHPVSGKSIVVEAPSPPWARLDTLPKW